MDPISHHKPTGCFNFKSVLGKPKTPLVLRKSRGSGWPSPAQASSSSPGVRRRRQAEVVYHDFTDLQSDRKSKPVVLPDVVATLSPDENILESQGGPNQDKIILEKLEEENLRLKAIFKLHSIKIQEDGGEASQTSQASETRRRSSSGSARVSSISSESSSASVQSGKEFEQKKMKNRSGKSRAGRSGLERKDNDIARNAGSNSVRNDNVTCHTQQQIKTRGMTNTRLTLDRGEVGSAGSQERRGSKGIIKPTVTRPVRVQDDEYQSSRVRYHNYHFTDTTSRPGFVFLGNSGHVVAECHGHPTNSRIIVKTVRDEINTDQDNVVEEEFDEEKICAAQKLRLISAQLEEEMQ